VVERKEHRVYERSPCPPDHTIIVNVPTWA
jgi:hypothetical protein